MRTLDFRLNRHLLPGAGRVLRHLGWALLLTFLVACSESSQKTTIDDCRDLLDGAVDQAGWDAAIAGCPDDGGTGTSLLSQAHMGRAGISLLDLLDGLEGTTLQGEALIFDVFTLTVGSTEYADAVTAVQLMGTITEPSTTDFFNITIASDVLLMSLFKARLAVSVDATTGALVVPGVTDTGIENLTTASATSQIQTVFNNIYTNNALGSGSYYTTSPLVWEDAAADVDLSRISDFVAANQLGSEGLGLTTDPDLADLAQLALHPRIDNGTCGLSTGQTASGADNAADGPLVARNFPRRLNTSDDLDDNLDVPQVEPEHLTEDLSFVLLTLGVADAAKEWAGEFKLASSLLNPDFVQVECDGDTTPATGEFSTCMTGEKLVATFSARTDEATPTDICALGACTHWPLLGIDGDVTTDETSAANLTAAKTELARVFHILAPIDNSVTAPTGSRPAYACAADDGLVHYREYDAYLRNFQVQ
jgi:hypothetical protein